MDKKVVSFSPNLYPYIDHGWATTIHKAQGTTVDHVKLLASYEQYRNLTYVGMSRHRHSLQVFASDLDFWRDEKIFDRLSRVQEKLSGFDYMDNKKLEAQIDEDTPILWHERKIQQGKDLLAAIKVTVQDVLGLTTPHAKAPEREYISFDISEETRSKEVFKTHDSNSKETTIFAVRELDHKRIDFDLERLSFHQKWCAKMGFMQQHKRLPRSAEELNTAYWQGERLTVIEGRLYKQALELGKEVKPDDLIQQAREELYKHQKAPDNIMAFAKASELTPHQQEQFEQHVLMHRYKTGSIPTPSDLKAICQAIETHQQLSQQETVLI